jgi:enoyl-CoA hydratase/carnithine racemase
MSDPAEWRPQSGHVEAAIEDGVLSLTINPPDKKNAITGAMYADLADALDFADSHAPVRAALTSGRGGGFTADAEALRAIMDAELACFQERLGSAEAREVFTAFLEKRKPDLSKLA